MFAISNYLRLGTYIHAVPATRELLKENKSNQMCIYNIVYPVIKPLTSITSSFLRHYSSERLIVLFDLNFLQ